MGEHMEIVEFKNRLWDLGRDFSSNMEKIFCPIVDKYGLTTLQTRVLSSILENKELTVGEVATKLNLTGGNASALCKKLEKSGLLERSRCKEDERRVILRVSKRGEEILLEMKLEIEKRFETFLENETEESLLKVIDGLEKARDFLKNIAN